MLILARKFKSVVTALFVTIALIQPLSAQSGRLDGLFERLARAGEGEWQAIEEEIWNAWLHSGSAAMDLLLERGRKAMQAEDWEAAIAHFTALVDHAPDFAEGWNARATAYFNAGLYGPALADIARALQLEPRHFGALTGLGVILEETGNGKAALEAYRRALAIHPRKPEIKEAVERLEKELGGTEL